MYLNSPHSIVPGTRNFFLSISGSVDFAVFSTMTGIRSGYFESIRLASAALFSDVIGGAIRGRVAYQKLLLVAFEIFWLSEFILVTR